MGGKRKARENWIPFFENIRVQMVSHSLLLSVNTIHLTPLTEDGTQLLSPLIV